VFSEYYTLIMSSYSKYHYAGEQMLTAGTASNPSTTLAGGA